MYDPVPVARNSSQFGLAEITADEIVLFDHERLSYHTLNSAAFAIWQRCDGKRNTDEISSELIALGIESTPCSVRLGVIDLAGAGLLEEDSAVLSDTRFDRKTVLKGALAAAVGGLVLPSISSITAPVAANSTTCTPGLGMGNGIDMICNCSAECADNCCCARGSRVTCENPAACTNPLALNGVCLDPITQPCIGVGCP